jgi:hypothetical protein
MRGRASREKIASHWSSWEDNIIVLRPYTRARTSAGGYAVTAGAPRPPQAFAIAMASSLVSRPQDSTSPTEDGTIHTMELILVGRIGSLVAVDDRFTYRGQSMRVVDVRNDPDGVYAEAVEFGG